MLRVRFVTALILAPIILGAIVYGNWAVVAVVLLVVIARAAQELARALDKLPFVAAFGAGQRRSRQYISEPALVAALALRLPRGSHFEGPTRVALNGTLGRCAPGAPGLDAGS